jgi:Mor family transcriptional regulator
MHMEKLKPDYYSDKEWYVKRNKGVLKDKQAGMSNKDLVKKYDVSPARIQYLVKHERSKNEFKR